MPTPADSTRKQQRKMSKREMDAYSREMMKVRWAQKRRRRIRNRILLVVGIVVVVSLVGTGAVLELRQQAAEATAGPSNMLSDGIVLTGNGTAVTATTTARIDPGGSPVTTPTTVSTPSGVLPIVLYLDYGDPSSATFGAAQMSQISTWLKAGYVTLEIHPIAPAAGAVTPMPNPSATATPGATTATALADYSARAANALACVANTVPDSFLAVSTALLTAAAASGWTPPADDQLVLDVQNAGVANSTVSDCITSHRYASWVGASTARALAAIPNADVAKVTTTPLALVGKTSFTGTLSDPTAFTSFISSVYSASSAAAG